MIRVVVAGGGTGGHLMPALALAEALAAERADVEPVLVGAVRGVEAVILPTRPWRFTLLPLEPIYRRQWWKNLRWVAAGPRVLSGLRRLFDRERPALVVGTGGYAAGPVLWAAARRGLPIALQEQNALPGVTTRRLAARARQIHLAYPEAAARLAPGPTTAVTTYGNPITPPAAVPRDEARRRLGLAPGARVLLVMGGSQGARALNTALAGALDAGLLGDVTVLWSTGPAHGAALERYHAPPHVVVRSFWDPIAEAYAASDLAVARAGAMSAAELCAWGLPAVYVPLPSAAADHQSHNARALEQAGAALVLPEPELTPTRLAGVVGSLMADQGRRDAMARAGRSRGRPDAARLIARDLLTLL